MAISVSTIARWNPTLLPNDCDPQVFLERQNASGMRPEYHQASIDDLADYKTPVLQAIDSIKDGRSKGILLSGRPGRGKTYAACAILNSFLSISRGMFLSLNGIKRSAFSRSGDFDSMSRIRGTGLLVIDDLGHDKHTAWLLGVIHDVLDARITNGRPTIVTTNFGDNIYQRLASAGEVESAEAIVSRLNELFTIKLEGGDRRGIKPV